MIGPAVLSHSQVILGRSPRLRHLEDDRNTISLGRRSRDYIGCWPERRPPPQLLKPPWPRTDTRIVVRRVWRRGAGGYFLQIPGKGAFR
jgi:hypothetical protein